VIRSAQDFIVGSEPFDCMGVSVRRFGYAIERTLDLFEANQKRAGQRRTRDIFKALASSDFDGARSGALTNRHHAVPLTSQYGFLG